MSEKKEWAAPRLRKIGEVTPGSAAFTVIEEQFAEILRLRQGILELNKIILGFTGIRSGVITSLADLEPAIEAWIAKQRRTI